jgi:hypothetical protein
MRRVVLTVVLGAVVASGALAGTSGNEMAEVRDGQRFSRGNAVRAGSFAEVEIAIGDGISISDISGLARAAGSDLEVLDDGKAVRVQLPAATVEALAAEGVQVTELRRFVLVEGGGAVEAGAGEDVGTLGVCSGDYHYGESPLNVYLLDGYNWYGSGIDFSLAPGAPLVTCIDIHYEVRNLSWSSIVDVEFSDENYNSYTYSLVSGWWGFDGDISQTRTGISAYNGKSVKQAWYLWAIDYYADGYGYIDYWWIKLYYSEPTPDYCEAVGDCSVEYISDVAVGAINNTGSGCTDGYSDFTSMSTVMRRGSGCPITVVNGEPDPDSQCGIWVDWNQDLDFDDASETIAVSGTPGVGPYTATVTPPAGASLGDTRMRIRIQYTGPVSSCGYDYGEVEDYTITVIPAATLLGDFVAPGVVDMRDFAVLAGQWQDVPSAPWPDIWPACPDGVVDWHDVAVFCDNWLRGEFR